MKTSFILLLFIIALAGCSTSKHGCPGSNSGPKGKSSKFGWYNN